MLICRFARSNAACAGKNFASHLHMNFEPKSHGRSFHLPNLPHLGDKTKEYAEQRLLGYSMEQMYEIVADVGKYTEFVPWCKLSRVINKSGPNFAQADLMVGFPPIVERYLSNLTFKKPNLVKSVCCDGKLFENLTTIWQFSPGLPDNEKSCTLDFEVKFEFRSAVYAQLSSFVFDELVRTMVQAFLNRAKNMHGPASIRDELMKPKIVKFSG